MALTVANGRSLGISKYKAVTATVTFDASYPTGGESLPLAQLGLNTCDLVLVSGGAGYPIEYDYANKKLKAYATAGVEVTNETDLHTVSCKIIAFGT